jgi:hypothetical protein
MAEERISIVVTTISEPNKVLNALASGSIQNNRNFIAIGDEPSPDEFEIKGCDYYSIDRQLTTGFDLAKNCAKRHYARKNIGYLLAIRDGSNVIVDTDDDNMPYPSFWSERQRKDTSPFAEETGWLNIYRYFSNENIWPRGLPLDKVQLMPPAYNSLRTAELDCPIQQGLANDNPDVDAIYRLVLPLPQVFRSDRRIALKRDVWCPFNSQNTMWWSDAFPLLYLPSHCSFRMTDIWRSFVAQRIAWENNWSVLFHEPTVWQERNEHNLMKDFHDELPGYLHNDKICEELGKLNIKSGVSSLFDNLKICYERMIELGFVDAKELPLLENWESDFKKAEEINARSIGKL